MSFVAGSEVPIVVETEECGKENKDLAAKYSTTMATTNSNTRTEPRGLYFEVGVRVTTLRLYYAPAPLRRHRGHRGPTFGPFIIMGRGEKIGLNKYVALTAGLKTPAIKRFPKQLAFYYSTLTPPRNHPAPPPPTTPNPQPQSWAGGVVDRGPTGLLRPGNAQLCSIAS